MLTRKQKQLLDYITLRLADGACPSYEEMAAAIGVQSKSGVHRLVVALEERGFIRRIKERARSIELVGKPVPGSEEFGVSACLAGIVSSGYRDVSAYAASIEAILKLARKHGVDTGHVLVVALGR